MTCEDCVHHDICLEQYSGLTPEMMFRECKKFKNKANFVEAIRCRDCQRCYNRITKRNKQIMYFCMRMDGNEFQVNANDYCSYGRKEKSNG